MKPVAAKFHRQPKYSNKRPSNGIPIAEENFAAESNMAVSRQRPPFGNQKPGAFSLAGKGGDPPNPQKTRAPKKTPPPRQNTSREQHTTPKTGTAKATRAG